VWKTSLVLLSLCTLASASPRSVRRAKVIGAVGTVAPLALTGAGIYLMATAPDGGPRGALGLGMTGIGAAALVFTPSLGRYTVEDHWPQTMTTIRGVGLGVAALGGGVELFELIWAKDCQDCKPHGNVGLVIAAVGGATMLGGAIYDVATISVVPVATHDQMGVALAGRF
jgi:hypothetical protein